VRVLQSAVSTMASQDEAATSRVSKARVDRASAMKRSESRAVITEAMSKSKAKWGKVVALSKASSKWSSKSLEPHLQRRAATLESMEAGVLKSKALWQALEGSVRKMHAGTKHKKASQLDFAMIRGIYSEARKQLVAKKSSADAADAADDADNADEDENKESESMDGKQLLKRAIASVCGSVQAVLKQKHMVNLFAEASKGLIRLDRNVKYTEKDAADSGKKGSGKNSAQNTEDEEDEDGWAEADCWATLMGVRNLEDIDEEGETEGAEDGEVSGEGADQARDQVDEIRSVQDELERVVEDEGQELIESFTDAAVSLNGMKAKLSVLKQKAQRAHRRLRATRMLTGKASFQIPEVDAAGDTAGLEEEEEEDEEDEDEEGEADVQGDGTQKGGSKKKKRRNMFDKAQLKRAEALSSGKSVAKLKSGDNLSDKKMLGRSKSKALQRMKEAKRRSQNLSEEVKNAHMNIRQKLLATADRKTWVKLFQKYDEDAADFLNFDKFQALIRETSHLPTQLLSDQNLQKLFKDLDSQSDGVISYIQDVFPWLLGEDDEERIRAILLEIEQESEEASHQRLPQRRATTGVLHELHALDQSRRVDSRPKTAPWLSKAQHSSRSSGWLRRLRRTPLRSSLRSSSLKKSSLRKSVHFSRDSSGTFCLSGHEKQLEALGDFRMVPASWWVNQYNSHYLSRERWLVKDTSKGHREDEAEAAADNVPYIRRSILNRRRVNVHTRPGGIVEFPLDVEVLEYQPSDDEDSSDEEVREEREDDEDSNEDAEDHILGDLDEEYEEDGDEDDGELDDDYQGEIKDLERRIGMCEVQIKDFVGKFHEMFNAAGQRISQAEGTGAAGERKSVLQDERLKLDLEQAICDVAFSLVSSPPQLKRTSGQRGSLVQRLTRSSLALTGKKVELAPEETPEVIPESQRKFRNYIEDNQDLAVLARQDESAAKTVFSMLHSFVMTHEKAPSLSWTTEVGDEKHDVTHAVDRLVAPQKNETIVGPLPNPKASTMPSRVSAHTPLPLPSQQDPGGTVETVVKLRTKRFSRIHPTVVRADPPGLTTEASSPPRSPSATVPIAPSTAPLRDARPFNSRLRWHRRRMTIDEDPKNIIDVLPSDFSLPPSPSPLPPIGASECNVLRKECNVLFRRRRHQMVTVPDDPPFPKSRRKKWSLGAARSHDCV